jgi:competence protein ComEC
MLFHDGVHALGTVLDASINHRIDTGHRPLDSLRERIASHISSRVADRDAAALISALAVGVTGSMSREQWRVFNATGTTHLVAISGLHVTLFAVVAFAAARTLWSLLLYRFVPWQRENFAALVGFVAAAGYATLAGLSVPTQRTLIMLGVWLFTRSIARVSAPFHSFALAIVAVLIFDPFAPLTPGFWLSFTAMGAIILLTGTRFTQRRMFAEALAVQAAVTVALVPVTLVAFGSVSLIGPVVNLAAIPAMSWIFVPTILLSVLLAPVLPDVSDHVLDLAAWMHDIAWPWLAAAADVPWALVHASPPAWWYALASVGVFLSLMPWPVTLRLAVVVWVFPLATIVDSHPAEGVAEITVLDVGEGTSVIVQTARHVLVYEIGEGYGTDGRIAESVVVPFLRSRGVRRIDVLALNRLTAVNGPGVTALLAEMPVNETLVGGEAGMDLPGARRCPSDRAWDWDGVRLTAVNTGACMIRVESGGARGLAGPSATEFVRADGAHWAVVPGRRDRNGHEKPAVRRWQEAGATVLATGDLGAIRFRLDPDAGLQGPDAARLDSHAPWRLPP